MSWLPRGLDAGDASGTSSTSERRPAEVVHGEIIEYLKRITRELKATFVDIERDLGIDLHVENYILDMLKSNPKVECERSGETDELSFRYRTKFSIANKSELIQVIDRVQSGIAVCDITTPPCYPGIEMDIANLIVGGDVIACKNKALKTAILYPRGRPFLSVLDGGVTATPGQQSIRTSNSLLAEIRRGDAIGLSGSWYRVASNVGTAGSHQAERATAPLSVTSDMELSDRNVYRDLYDSSTLPLDGDYDGETLYVGPALRHGVGNDIRNLWKQTLDKAKEFKEGDSLRLELVKCKLLSSVGTQQKSLLKLKEKKGKERKKRKARDTGRVFNAHLKGSALDEAMKALNETHNPN